MYIWSLFIIISAIDQLNITNKCHIHLYYLCADFISKLTTNIIITDYDEREKRITDNMDLQGINFIENMIKPMG